MIDREGIRRYARRSTEASFALEGHDLPGDYVRSARLEQWLRDRRERWYSVQQTDDNGSTV